MTNNEALPSELPGIDLAEALARTGIPAAVLRPILLRFVEKNCAKGQEFFAVLSKGDLQALRLMAHTLKGAVATFGATTLPQACLAVEMAVEEGKDVEEITELVKELVLALDVVLTSLAGLRQE